MSGREPVFEDEGVPSLNDRLAAELPEVGPLDLGVWVDDREALTAEEAAVRAVVET
jgi:hypothetical protein